MSLTIKQKRKLFGLSDKLKEAIAGGDPKTIILAEKKLSIALLGIEKIKKLVVDEIIKKEEEENQKQ